LSLKIKGKPFLFFFKRIFKKTKTMKHLHLLLLTLCICVAVQAQQMTARPSIEAKKVAKAIKIDGKLDEVAWKDAAFVNNFIEFRPTAFKPENSGNKTEIFLMYNNDGIYVGGKCFEQNADSIAKELIGRDGFNSNNDFIGITLDTYNDKINGFEYFITPLSEQMDAKISAGNEDGDWNAVWEGKSIVEKDGWSFEIFIPFSAIRFGKGKVQNWGLNFIRKRIKSGQLFSWASVNPQINGFLPQEGFWNGVTDVKPPLRLQFSPYVSYYATSFSKTAPGEKKVVNQFNGGMDVKYGINQAFTLDMALIPDFGQVQTDYRVLNITPFEQQFSERRPFFTEGTELFSKGGLLYTRRIGKNPNQVNYAYDNSTTDEAIIKDPQETKIANATKISGRMQNGLAIGVLNAITSKQNATIQNTVTKDERKVQSFPLTNYNMIVIDKTLKHNSSVSFANTNVMRSGRDYDANVSMVLANFNDKTNTWNIGGQAGVSNLIGAAPNAKTISGYTQSIYFGKTSGKLNFNISSDYTDKKFDKNDMGYQSNNNTFDNGFYVGYNINKPKGWYNRIGGNLNGYLSSLASPLDPLKQKGHMFQEYFMAANFFGQTKKLWFFYANINNRIQGNDYYEARQEGRVFKRGGRTGLYMNVTSNEAKKYSFSPEIGLRWGRQFKGTSGYTIGFFHKLRLNQKLSINHGASYENNKNQAGFADFRGSNILFAKRDTRTIQNTINVKYSFTNKMGLTLNVRHYWSGVDPTEILLLNTQGKLEKPSFTTNVPSFYARNFNSFALNMIYTWQVANGSFLNIAWQDEANEFVAKDYEQNYFTNIKRTFNVNNANTISVKLVYFIDYLNLKKRK
jgi:Domain of unknown function (DUF5916)